MISRRSPTVHLFVASASLLSLIAATPTPAAAQAEGRAEQLLELLKSRPRTMSVDTWREQRREAVRELGRLKERRAVPSLLVVIDKERFDVILEIAIDALGSIGDRRAVAPLKRLLDDPSLDAYVRDAAASALKKLEAADSGTGTGTRPRTTPRTSPRTTPDAPPVTPAKAEPDQALGREFAKLPRIKLAEVGVDTIARSTRMDLVLGAGHLDWDSRSERTRAGLSLQSHYRRQLEAKKLGYTFDLAGDFAFDLADPPVGDATWQLGHNLQLNPEIRFYPFTRDVPLLFGQLSGGLGYGLGVARVPATPDKRFTFAGVIAIGGGPGYGRIYDIGQRLRLRRLARVLRRVGAIKEDLDPNVGNQVLQLWYQLRDKLGSYQQLGQTLRLLRQADVLKNEPIDPAAIYRLVRILDDPQLDDRFAGLMFRGGYGYARSLLKDADDVTQAFAYATAAYQLQRGTTRALGLDLRFFYNMWGTPDTYNVHLTGHYAWYLYNRAFDPLGALQLDLSAGLNNQPGSAFDGGGVAYNFLAGASYARYFSRGSRVVASLRGGAENGGALIMFALEAHYGIARGSFVEAK